MGVRWLIRTFGEFEAQTTSGGRFALPTSAICCASGPGFTRFADEPFAFGEIHTTGSPRSVSVGPVHKRRVIMSRVVSDRRVTKLTSQFLHGGAHALGCLFDRRQRQADRRNSVVPDGRCRPHVDQVSIEPEQAHVLPEASMRSIVHTRPHANRHTGDHDVTKVARTLGFVMFRCPGGGPVARAPTARFRWAPAVGWPATGLGLP
jgi:hypothetical protein